ncbi:hypothetical protein [Bacillus subtilis]|uniref:Uncharacterized protein n=1 Tax=Bacillus subtilis TaxID=1423 RepID=A0A1J0AKS9_BACIU|nr:hypothetical protein [Bacillus subtilis]APB62343.1 hypothetical protein pBS72_0740 [Bacillus subtilis]
MIIVNLVFRDYQIKSFLEGDYKTEKKRLGNNFEKVMYDRAIAQTEQDRWTSPPLRSFCEEISE